MTPDPFSTWLNNFADQLRKPKEEPEVLADVIAANQPKTPPQNPPQRGRR